MMGCDGVGNEGDDSEFVIKLNQDGGMDRGSAGLGGV